MTPLTAAQAHCANYQLDGSCLGATIDDDLQIRRCSPALRCLLAKAGQRCGYFEQIVIPMGSGDWPGLRTPQQHQAFADAIRDYRRTANFAKPQGRRLCPECRQRELEPKHRLCHICKKQRRRNTFKRASSKIRGSDVNS